MSDKSAIEWTDATWNPIRGETPNRWMCKKISPGCDNCYASTLNRRFGGSFYQHPNATESPIVRLDDKTLSLPLRWRAPRRVFVCSMTDLFGEWVPIPWIERVFRIMHCSPQHQFQVLTKRTRRMSEVMPIVYERIWGRANPAPLPNVWLGTSIELDRYAWRADMLRATPAAIRFISAEPLLGLLPNLNLDGIDWLITGGESGAHHRPMDAEWARDLRDRCQTQHVAYFHKQMGGRTHSEGGRLLDGREWNEFPQPRELVQA